MRIFSCAAVAAIFPGVVVCANPTLAAVYRCVDAGGAVSYQQIACSAESKPMQISDRPSGWSALRPGERALLKSYRDNEGARRREPRPSPAKPATVSKACWKKRKQLDAVRNRLHRGYRLKEADELHRKRSEYEDYLRQFCS